MRNSGLAFFLLLLTWPSRSGAVALCSTPACRSAAASVAFLARQMDEFHTRFPVYDDLSSAGNHFHAWAAIPNQQARVRISGGWTGNPHSGATAIRAELDPATPAGFGGFYFLNGVLPAGARAPQLNFGTIPNAGVDLRGATALTFWVRGLHGQETVDFFLAGVGRDPVTGAKTAPFPDSSPAVKRRIVLGKQWKQIRIDLAGKPLRYVLGGFGWSASVLANPAGAVFFLDDIQYELSPARQSTRLNEPRLLRSFETLPFQSRPDPVGDFDFVLRNSAHTYDNALAILAFLAEGSPDSLRRARLVGRALVYASLHDRTYTDGRLRDVYAAGDLVLPPGWKPNGKIGTVPIPGFFDEERQEFIEIEQGGVSTGNNAWGALALLALHRATGDPTFRTAALRIGRFVSHFSANSGTYQGFRGGLDGPETPTPVARPWASTEHNLDIHALFASLAEIDADPAWQQGAEHSRQFVEMMWDAARGCILAGTLDPDHRNELLGQLPVDTQSWTTLALPEILAQHLNLLECAAQHHRANDQGFAGFDFNDDRDGVWFEGTAHLAVAYAAVGREADAERFRALLRRAQNQAPFGDRKGLSAATHDGISTGFGFLLFRRLHVGATAWSVFAQLRFNPFYGVPLPAP